MSEGTDREDDIDEKKAMNASDSSDTDFVPSEENKADLQNFKFLFSRASYAQKGKLFRRKLKWLLCLLAVVK